MAGKKRKKKPPVATLYKEYFLNMGELLKAFVVVAAKVHELFPYECPNYGIEFKFPRLNQPSIRFSTNSKRPAKVVVSMDADAAELVRQLVNDAARRVAPSAPVFNGARTEWVGYLKGLRE